MNKEPTNKPAITHRQAKSAVVAQRIYATFRWELKKRDFTWLEVAKLLDTCIRLSMDEIPDETIRRGAIEHFRAAKGKCLGFAEHEEKANIAKLTGDACIKCGAEFAVDAPKTWVADGQYVCARCQ